jgi:hypothetical protein
LLGFLKSKEQRAKSKEHGAKSKEHGAKSKEQRAWSKEHGAKVFPAKGVEGGDKQNSQADAGTHRLGYLKDGEVF